MFWMKFFKINIIYCKLNFFFNINCLREDYLVAQQLKTDDEKRDFYEDIKAGAESGWDFSSRWFITNGSSAGVLTDISTKNIIPVDLNAFLQRNARLLSTYNERIGKAVVSVFKLKN